MISMIKQEVDVNEKDSGSGNIGPRTRGKRDGSSGMGRKMQAGGGSPWVWPADPAERKSRIEGEDG